MGIQNNSSYYSADSKIKVYLGNIPTEWIDSIISKSTIVDDAEAQISFFSQNNELIIRNAKDTFAVPLKKTNFISFFNQFERNKILVKDFEHPQYRIERVEKKLQTYMKPEEHSSKEGWENLIRSINHIKNETHSFHQLIEKVLNLENFKSYLTSSILLHIKGNSSAEIYSIELKSKKITHTINVREFNLFFNNIKKSKIKTFQTVAFPYLNTGTTGTFLAKEITSKKFSLIFLISRNEFLQYTEDEISDFNRCVSLLETLIEKIVDEDFSDTKISEIRLCLKEFPVPLKFSKSNELFFTNDQFSGEVGDTDLFYTKKIDESYSVSLFENQDLHHYAMDTFHFQRISLLGELLNTLRHELSNPLFGLKLGSQLYQSLSVNQDDNFIMSEIEKNINRCQNIIEDFSNLYLPSDKIENVSLKKILTETFLLAKSELRDVKKSVQFIGTEDVELNLSKMFLVQIFFNLIINSCQAMRDLDSKKEILINIQKNMSEIEINFFDTGPGISSENIQNIFKPFFTTKHTGTGLGLVLSRNLSLRLGGKLDYIPNPHKSGAHFKLILPL